MIDFKDIDFSDINEINTRTVLWGKEGIYTLLTVTSENGQDADELGVKKHLDFINEKLKWLDENKAIILREVVNQNGGNLARIWTEQSDIPVSEDEEGRFAKINGVRFAFPVTDMDFCTSLVPAGISVEIEEYIDKNHQKRDCFILLFLDCVPDYFKGNSLEIEISNKDNNISVKFHGIVG
ncbi:MAG: DUF2262 domain-containing protein [Clostridiales bacterium]|nr:DUF2262 domain-containing protein [Clostridiales bacterium]